MDRRTLLAITLCFLIYLGWHKFYVEPHMPSSQGGNNIISMLTGINPSSSAQSAAGTPESITSASGQGVALSPPTQQETTQPSSRSAHPAVQMPLETATGKAVISDNGQFLHNWTLKNYKVGISSDSAPVSLESVTLQNGDVNVAFDDPEFAYLNGVQGHLTQTPAGITWQYEDEKVKLSRVFQSSPQKPYIDLQVHAEFKSKRPKYLFLSLVAQGAEKDPEAQDRQLFYWTNQAIERTLLKDHFELKSISTPVHYIGAANRYFILALIAQNPVATPAGTASSETQPNGVSTEQPLGLMQPSGNLAGRISMVYPVTQNSVTVPARIFFGPKDLTVLRQVDPLLDHTVDFGWFTLFAYPLLKILKWLYQFVQNYGLAIIFLTILLKIVTYPLTYKSMKSMKKMAKLQPQLQRLREKYKDDKEALNREMLTLMRGNGYNPMAGCLPILIQMPIFFALYRVLYSSIELYHAPFMLWIHDLSSHDPFYVTPVLLSLTMFVQQKLTPNTATDPAQAKMMQFMPLIFGAFMLALPAGLTVYMLVNAIASIVQQLILNKKLDPAPAR